MTTQSDRNLQEAFAGESQATQRYLAFADRARGDGFPQVARLFRAAAEAETVHARNHLRAMKGIAATADNVKTAISGEFAEFTRMYPGFIEQAKADKNSDAETTFTYANKVEKIHHSLYQQALRDVEAGKPAKSAPYFVCQTCGNTVAGAAPEVCPICGMPKDQFKKVE